MAVNSAPYTSGPGRGFTLFGLDWPLLVLVLLLSVWGCFTIVSATQLKESRATSRSALDRTPSGPSSLSGASTGKTRIPEATKQMAFIGVGLLAMAALTLCNYQWLVHLQGSIYLINLLALAGLLFLPSSIAPTINGAKSWIVLGPISLQLSEFSKFALLISMAAFVTRRQENIGEFKTIILSFLYLLPPLLLILKQPDFGTTMATLSIWFGILFFGGARLKHLALLAALGVLLFSSAWYGGVLKPHQKARLASFLNPSEDPKSDGYQLNQSLIAIGGGQVTGQGYGQGMQNNAGYVPENQTDFIFTVVAEELGFAGAAILVLLYLLLLARTASLALVTENYFGVLLCGGFTALLAFHCIVNIGMTMRVMPITGVPLPFFSYGGSSFLAFSMCVGLLQSIVFHRR